MERETNLMDYEIEFAEYLMLNAYGKDNALTAPELNNWGRGVTIRSMVNALRSEGYPICSGRKGYYYAQDRDEIKQTLNNLESRISSMREACVGLYSAYLEQPE